MSLFSPLTKSSENPVLFAKYKPKVQAYRDALAAGILDEYKLPDELIPKKDGVDVTVIPKKFLSESEFAITESSGTDLVKKISKGELTAVEVFKAFAKRATAAHQLTNCAMQLFVDEGLQRAKELDEYFQKTGKTVGPLHGLPVSLKEHYDYKGKVTHAGYAVWVDRVTDDWALTVKLLSEAGAVFYIRTNEPQSLMHLCSNNNIVGLAKNPNNTSLTTGGSSSGEGAMAAMKGSVFGLGSDIGGSIRCPAGFCGAWGLRPTQKRVSMRGVASACTGVQEGVCCVLGPLAHSADDINLFMSAVIGGKPWERDATVIPLPWRKVSEPNIKNLTVAICYDDGVVKPTPPIIRGLKLAASKLKAAGATVVEWEPIEVEKLIATCGSMYNSDSASDQLTALGASGEPLAELTKVALSFGCGEKGTTTQEYQRLAFTRDTYRDKYQDTMSEKGIDFILTPVYVSVAAKPETVHYWGYTNLWNLLDLPNVVFPTGLKCDPALDAPDKTYKARSDVENYEYALYDDADEFKGAPINLQLTGRRWFDEELVKASKVVQAVISS
ncbi:DEKNAAC101054 [Brettanomyces naardenensis]|uniref:DEKNAAC101054 n=1 Tax=Brettanomyces naardenensis TaxID=13370 RepID=A0A448YGS9_BRENA|nr:DEKNAAC101054 [Brettanomyces naardenensis]